ncbi:MAG: hypothetical protein U0163_07730 [Gemmatimonadaceae bacterium]
MYRQAVSGSGRPRGTPDRVTTGLNVFTFTPTRDGSQMAYSTLRLRSNIWMAPILPNGTTPSSAAHAVTTEKQSIEGLALSHDGKWLAYDSNRNGNLDIFKIAFNGTSAAGDAVALRPTRRRTMNRAGRLTTTHWSSIPGDTARATCSRSRPTGVAKHA